MKHFDIEKEVGKHRCSLMSFEHLQFVLFILPSSILTHKSPEILFFSLPP